MISYINVHAVLDGRRNRAKASPSDSDTSQVLFGYCSVQSKSQNSKGSFYLALSFILLVFCSWGIQKPSAFSDLQNH